jgi:hypothetical protein
MRLAWDDPYSLGSSWTTSGNPAKTKPCSWWPKSPDKSGKLTYGFKMDYTISTDKAKLDIPLIHDFIC